MKNLKIAVVAAFATAALAQAPADAGRNGESSMARKAPAVSVSGEYSGGLTGTILLGGETVVVPKNTLIIDPNGRKLERGASVTGRLVRASGHVREGKFVAILISVGDPVSKQDFSEVTLPDVEADPDRAR